ncbi:universal stress protein family domain protein [Erythrobacter sp. KY5]|uniref:universal stress protein n=1 Tax=Erythrobacter sp. KY5 TaxID=2011159 RepID=UPI000DBF1C01|nr:universal stress protein [Erythrobacter sp. KY5]AWW74175.1 universal stress protein family domain protein [Erythrobacter sp. KY5]
MKSILLHVDGDRCMEARLQVALDLARASGGHITCLQAVSYEVFAPGDFYGSAMAAAMPRIKEAAEELRREIETDLANEDVAWEWRFLYGMAEQRLLEQSALHDIIIVGPHDVGEEGSRGPSSMVGQLAIHAPVPVLVVPGDTKKFEVTAPVLIGWNGSPEAATALRMALPILAKSSQVYIACVAEKNEKSFYDFPPTEAAIYLSRHGIEAEVISIPKGDAKIADTLFSAAQMRDCGMIVMGAYGHSRLAEMLLGGVTRRMLSEPQTPILLGR